uniref:(northern house mosquito) hypothetical protein n=1 Tax=Culex pipiens TaxID=7175 RepID=A0A8D8J572_CULPI
MEQRVHDWNISCDRDRGLLQIRLQRNHRYVCLGFLHWRLCRVRSDGRSPQTLVPSGLQSKTAAADHPSVLLLDRRPEHHLRLGARSPDPPQILGNERRPAQLKPGLPVRPRGLADAAKTPGVHQEGSLDRHVGH